MTVKQTIGKFFFQWRALLPVPLVLSMFRLASPKKINWIIGLPFVFLGELLRIWGLMHIGPTTRTREICADRLITSGPYSYCRNPLYLANFLKISGFIIISGDILFAFITLFFYLFEFMTMIPYEESFLAGKFPEEHKKYRELIPAFIPCFKNASQFNGASEFSFMESLRSEKKTFGSSAAILLILLGKTFCCKKGTNNA